MNRFSHLLAHGGILLALSTTIVGGLGGYLMRVAKSILVGQQLNRVYMEANQAPVLEGLATLNRIEQALLQRATRHPRISVLEGSQRRERMLQELARSSAALLAYSSVAYAERSSGVFWLYAAMRLACGLPSPLLIHPSGWLWREAQAFGMPCVALPEPATAAEALQRLAEVLQLSGTAPALTPYGQSVVGQPWDQWVVDQLEADRID